MNVQRLFGEVAVLAVALTALTGGAALAQQADEFGAGVVLGSPIGATGKYWMSRTQAVDIGLGIDGGGVLYGDYEWHAWDLFPQPPRGKFGGYVGVGPRLGFDDSTGGDFGVRTIGGLDYWVENHPIEVFLEAGPVFQVAPNAEVYADVGLGVRFYFNPPAPPTPRSAGASN